MTARSRTIAQTITEIRDALQEYIEATYHVGHPDLIEQRKTLLDREGVLFRAPYIESTPRYVAGQSFSDLDIPLAAQALLLSLTERAANGSTLLHDPPYRHQAEALELTTRDGMSLVVTTGTGSGKTESFLLPILAKLAQEAATNPTSFAEPAIRALLLYPMNALVNDQLGRLRMLFGDARVSTQFTAWAGRPARFARYTSRTLYPGVRTAKKDQIRLRSIERFYVSLLEQANDTTASGHERAIELIANLRSRGKWPAKPDLQAWYGASGQRWQNTAGEFIRAVLRPEDPELLTRHEVLTNPPDLLVTNYSMLEYTLMRPLERPIYDATRNWLQNNPNERLLLVVDEAHMYRGAAGAEVGLLLRRLRSRLGIEAERLQVICTSASFDNPDYARDFAAQLTGKRPMEFRTVVGTLALRPTAAPGSQIDAEALAAVPLEQFYDASADADRRDAVEGFLDYRQHVPTDEPCAVALYAVLHDFPPMGELVNLTMTHAARLDELATAIFPDVEQDLADRALTTLVALGSTARRSEDEPGLLPCRIHTFFRGLPGLWACLDPHCPDAGLRVGSDSPVGALYSQPQATCSCGARVFELYTCRNCGSAYARAYTDNLEEPSFLWNEPGSGFKSGIGDVPQLWSLDLLLEDPTGVTEPADIDLVTGRLNPSALGSRVRQVHLPPKRSGDAPDSGDDADGTHEATGEFNPCGVCDTAAWYGRTSVQDHQTKGDQPFQALVTRQIEVQPPGIQAASDFAPLRGRKVLAFSDSRQTAARLAPNLQTYSMQDVLRPIMLRGWRELAQADMWAPSLSLEDLYLAVLVGARLLSVRLRPELKGAETLDAVRDVADILSRNALHDPAELFQLQALGAESPPESLLRGMIKTLTDRYYGLTSLGLASVRERQNLQPKLDGLPAIAGVAETPDAKLALVRAWLGYWASPRPGIWFRAMPDGWWQTSKGVQAHAGRFAGLDRWISDKAAKKTFEKEWLPLLLETFCVLKAPKKYQMRALNLALDLGIDWGYCQRCRTTQRPFPGTMKCINCCRDNVVSIDPENDAVFKARKGYYRGSSVRALGEPAQSPFGIIAAEHTAQLNAAQSDEVFSKAEEHELLFQDVNLGVPTPGERDKSAIDVLSCTTTMEVGIDIGTLSGVALRNMPPSRASYQQRAGRAGRRGNAVATVVAFGSADSHDEHYFTEPEAMIRGRVDDPVLTLDNDEIARRHVTAYLFQQYHQMRLPQINPEQQPQLFEVLGTVDDFLGDTSPLNRDDFEGWLRQYEYHLKELVDDWLPTEISAPERQLLLDTIVNGTLRAVDSALSELAGDDAQQDTTTPQPAEDDESDTTVVELAAEEGEEVAQPRRTVENLLDRLLYKGVLPRYAFPTDVVSFYVFDRDRSTRFRTEYQYAPSQGLPVALTQYAPGKQLWIDGKLWTSGALYSPMPDERYSSWKNKQLYFECTVCHYASHEPPGDAKRGDIRSCPACGTDARFGPARTWIRPPGFAHRMSQEEGTSLDDQPARSYATRAKLVAPGPSDSDGWQAVTPHLRRHYRRTELLVTNTGPRREGYTYCARCGLIEPTAIPTDTMKGNHPKPYPDDHDQNCVGSAWTAGLVLGTDFISDVLLVGLRVEQPLTLRPGYMATDVALRTLAEAITIAATRHLGIEPTELQAEYRPALNQGGHQGLEAEIYLYDTLAGGAGFARRVGELDRTIFDEAISLLQSCPADCDRSCYRCLRSFRNRFEHDLLDRHVGASLLGYLVNGDAPTLDKARLEAAADRLYEDLSRHGLTNVSIDRNALVDVQGIGSVEAPILVHSADRDFIVGIHGPLTPDHAADEQLRDAKEYGTSVPVILVDEIIVSRNLPYASSQVIQAIS